MAPRVFISYNHKAPDFRDRVVKVLKADPNPVEVLTDESVNAGQNVHPRISELLNNCDVVVPIITDAWLSSHETRDELVRAHERRMYIVCLFDECAQAREQELPFFVKETLRISFSSATGDLETQVLQVKKAILAFDNYWKKPFYGHVHRIADVMGNTPVLPAYKLKHLEAAFDRASGEIATVIQKDEFSLHVNYEENFLVAASPYFGTAKSISAISIAKISTFWSDQKVQYAARRYLQEQSRPDCRVTRLFVFESAEEVVRFKNILQANFRAYGHYGGGVFIASKGHYLDVLQKISTDGNFLNEVEGRDFGLLTYEDNGEEAHLYASLNTAQLAIRRVSKQHYQSMWYRDFSELFQDMLRIEEGTVDARLGVLRWSESLYVDRPKLADGLAQLFPASSGKILHLVLIDAKPERTADVGRFLRHMKEVFESHKRELHITNLWVHERHDSRNPRDGVYSGFLTVSTKYDFVIGMEFENDDALQAYYLHRLHSELRRDLYCAIDPSLAQAFEPLTTLRVRDAQERAACFDEIERAVGERLFRIDVNVSEPIEELVKRGGIPFGGFNL